MQHVTAGYDDQGCWNEYYQGEPYKVDPWGGPPGPYHGSHGVQSSHQYGQGRGQAIPGEANVGSTLFAGSILLVA